MTPLGNKLLVHYTTDIYFFIFTITIHEIISNKSYGRCIKKKYKENVERGYVTLFTKIRTFLSLPVKII